LSKESRLGEFLMHVLFWIVWKLCSEHAWTVKYLNSDLDRVFWIFPKTVWRRMNFRQAAHAISLVSGFSPWTAWRQRMNRQAAHALWRCFWLFWTCLGYLWCRHNVYMLKVKFYEYSWLWILWLRWNAWTLSEFGG